jgi:hypothetical protein
MQTFTVNRISEMLEIDRGTAVRMLKNVPPDAQKTKGRPTFKISTAAKALEVHRRNVGTGNGGGGQQVRGGSGVPPALRTLYDKRDQMEADMAALPTLKERREAAGALISFTVEVDKATRANALFNGQDSDIVHLRADSILQLYARCIEGPCEWSHDEVWMKIIQEDGDPDD